MTKIEQLASRFNLYLPENAPETHREAIQHFIESGRYKPQYSDKLNPEDVKIGLKHERGLFLKCETENKGTEREHHFIDICGCHELLLFEEVDILFHIMPEGRWNAPKWIITPYFNEWYKYHKLPYHVRAAVSSEMVYPKKIGIFTDRKVLEWVMFGRDLFAKLDAALNEITGKRVENIAYIKTQADKMKRLGCRVNEFSETDVRIYSDDFSIYLNLDSDGEIAGTVRYMHGYKQALRTIEKLAGGQSGK